MKRAVLYMRVSSVDQHPESQLYDLRRLAEQRDLEIIREYTDHGVSGTRVRRPALDQMMTDARQGKFDVALTWAADRVARSVRHFLEVLDEFGRLNIEFVSFRENLDTGGALGRAVVIIVAAVAELERNLIVERVRAGMRRAKLEGRHIGRHPIEVDREAVLRERAADWSLTRIATAHGISRALVSRILKQAGLTRHKGVAQPASQAVETSIPESAA